jgi:hypothetical protein
LNARMTGRTRIFIGAGTILGKGAIMTESDFAEMAGVPQRTLMEMRKRLVRGLHWFKDGRSVHWTVCGQADALRSLGARKKEAAAALAEKNAAPVPDHDAPQTAVVVRKPRNRRVLLARLLDTGEEIVVRTKSSEKFPLRFEIPVRPVRAGDVHLWTLARKEPRWFGRW